MNTSFQQESKSILRAIVALAALVVASAATAQDSVVAIGKVSSAGAVTNSSNTVGGVVTATRPSVGQYFIDITSTGAFAGTDADDYVVNVGVEGSISGDVTALATVPAPTNDVLTIEVNLQSVEDSSTLNLAEARNNGFFFVVHRIPSSGAIDSGSRYLFATGRAGSGGGVTGGISPEGATVSGTRNGAGDYLLTVSKPGAFTGDSVNDYVILVTPDGLGPQDKIIRGDGDTAVSDDEIVFNVRVDDGQDETNDDSVIPTDRAYQFTIYRVAADPQPVLPASKLLRAIGKVDGSTGDLVKGASCFPGATVTGTRTGEGDYEILIEAPGQFVDSVSNEMVVQLLPEYTGVEDEVAAGRATVVDADTLRIDVGLADLETPGTDGPNAQDRDFFFVLHEAAAAPNSDLHIGRKRNLSKMKGDGRYNLNAAGQKLRVKSKGAAARYFFALENDADVVDTLQLRQKGKIKGVKPKFFRLSGGRKNVTAKVKSVGLEVDDMRPDKVILFQVKTRFLSDDTRKGKIRLGSSSQLDAAKRDTCLARIKRED